MLIVQADQATGRVIGFTLFWGLIALTILNFILFGLMFRWLRRDQPTIWDSLGKPSLILNNSIGSQLKVLPFVIGSGSRQVDSSRVRRICGVIRLVLLIYTIDFLIILVALVHSNLGSKH